MKELVSRQRREKCDIAHLKVGLKCGGSDPFSGITANPAVGLVSDRLVSLGATTILGEIPEMIGAEAPLASRIPDEMVRRSVLLRIAEYAQMARHIGGEAQVNLSPGNVRAGLSSPAEKSLGCIAKGGHCAIKEFVPYAGVPKSKGLVVMDTPGNDCECVCGMVAGGANLVLFTTGLGTPLGNPVAPVVKISSNTRTYQRMKEFTDIDAGRIIGGARMEEIADEIFDFLLEVCNGKETASEVNRCREFAINRVGPTF
jgi:altronate dehydratase large subunit